MPTQPAGAAWLQAQYKLDRYVLTHSSYIGNNASIELTSKGNVKQVYKKQYDPGDRPTDNLEFLLKYDDINLDFLKEVMNQIPKQEILAYIENAPSSKYSRKIGFLYEFLTGNKLNLKKEITGNYVNLLEEDRYITSNGIRNTRWRINDNFLGTPGFCPIVRKTRELDRLLRQDIKARIEELQKAFSPEIFRRATYYLYKKETKSSYEIEREEPSPDRMEKFVSLLMQAGTEPADQMLKEKRLVELQNAIVDPRFAVSQFRDFQNYIGQSLPNYGDLIHYICPPPGFVQSLMKGIQDTAQKTTSIPAEVRTAILAFGFVFIHPFEDGNGRIHRFLIHDVLASSGMVPIGTIIPVSAHMVNHRRDYDSILENYSKPLMQFISYEKKPDGSIIITNPAATEGYFRYPDLTDHCIYLAETIHATLSEDMMEELTFLQRYDEAKNELQNIVDMPDKMLNEMLLFLHQNKGVFPKRRRERFAQLTNEEINRMQSTFRRVFEIEDAINNN
jgi:hypothetical protein